MDPDVDPTKFSAMSEQNDDIVPDMQINPLTIMTSAPPFTPVDEEQQNVLASADINLLKPIGSETALTPSFNTDISSSNIIDQQNASNTHMDNRSVAAWVETTTSESSSSTLERSPSLPSTLLEPNLPRSRRNSTVSTICDHQSIHSDTLTSQQVSFSNDMQRSLSVPVHENYYHDNEDNELILPVKAEKEKINDNDKDKVDEEEDTSMQFLPVPESEDSEVDKKTKKLPSTVEEPVKLESRSPNIRANSKTSSNVSFHASVSFEPHHRPMPTHRRRRNSGNATKTRPPTFQRSFSHTANPPPPSLHAQILRKQFQTALSMPAGAHLKSDNSTRQSSSLSDNVFLSPSTTNSSRGNRFIAVPSSGSYLSDRNTSIISDASGRSGIESTNLESTSSDIMRRLDLDADDRILEKPALLRSPRRSSSTSVRSSTTPSTQSLSSSTDDDEMSFFNESETGKGKGKRKGGTDQRRDVLKQLMWLLEKKTTIYARSGLGHRKSLTPPRQQHHQKSTPNLFVEFCSTFRSHNAHNASSRHESDIPPKSSTRLFSSFNEPSSSQLFSLPLASQLSYTDPMNQSFSSIRSTHSDSSATNQLINTKFATRHSTNATTSLGSSLHFQRKRGHHRRTVSGIPAITRDPKISSNKTDQQISQQEPEQKSPLTRNVEAILNEHLAMINNLLLNFSLNASINYPSQNSSFRDFLYTRLNELSEQNPMNQRCSRVETKAFIDLISSFQMNRAHHYSFLTDSVKHLEASNNETIHVSHRFSENDDEAIRDGHMASNESSNASSPCLTRYASSELNEDGLSFEEHPLRYFRTLSPDYILDCERTENELKKLFDLADQQHILYCLKHVDSGHTNDSLKQFHRRLDALFVWFNLYYELTISVKKLSGLLRCDECEDWPQLRFRSIATSRERQARRADETDVDYETTSEDDEEGEEEDLEEVEEDLQSAEDNETADKEEEENDDSDILPKNRWPEEAWDHFSRLRISEDSSQNEMNATTKLDRIDCYRNFVYYMDKRSYQVKYDGLARTLIERIAPVLVKTRLALLQTTDRPKVKMEQILAGLSLSDFQSSNIKKSDSQSNLNIDETEDKLVDTDNPVDDDTTRNSNLGELTIEKWLYHVLKSCTTIKNICLSAEEILKSNWFELHEQLGLPPLLPLYLFIINVLLDVMNECLKLYHKPYMKDDAIEIDSLDRQQLVREAKLVLRDALATRLYSIRMMEHFISHRKIIYELTEFDENTVKLYMHYKQFLSTVCINRNFCTHDDESLTMNNDGNTEIFQYVDEETSELIKEYYFSRDLTVTLGNRTEIRDLCIDFSTLTQRILAQLKEELNGKTEKYYQTFAIDLSDTSSGSDGIYSADVLLEVHRPPLFCTSASVPTEGSHTESVISETASSFSEQKRIDIISKTREFRREFDVIKQRATRVCNLVKKLTDDFSIAAEFRSLNHNDLWQQLRQNSYTQIRISLDSRDSEDFDNFYIFVPPWLSNEKDEVEKLLSIICSVHIPADEMNKTSKDIPPSYMIFLPKKHYHRQKNHPQDKCLLIQPSESTKLALNSTEINCLHLVVNRYDQWQNAVDTFQSHVGLTNIQLIRKLPRDEDLRLTFDQLPEHIERLSIKLTDLVRRLNTIWNQDSTRIYLTEIIKFDENTIESKLVDLVLYIYNSGFDLFRLLYEFIPTISSDTDVIFKNFVSTMNDFFCEWCKCVAKKFRYTSIQQTRTPKYKVLRPKWISPGIVFLSFLAKPIHLQLLSEEDYKKLIKEMPAALDVLYGNIKDNDNNDRTKSIARTDSVSSTSTHLSRPRHRRGDSGSRYHETMSPFAPTTHDRIVKEMNNLENQLEKKYRERKQIGQIFSNTTTSNVPDPVISLRMRNIDFPWRRGTRIGQGGAGVAFRAINCSNGSIVCMKEIQLTSIASRLLPSTYSGKLRLIAEEIDMIMSINHPNIVRYFGIEKYKRTIYICMEYCLSTVNEFLNDIRSFQKRAHIKRKNSLFPSDSSEQDEDVDTQGIRINSSLDVNETVRGFVRQLLQALMALHEKKIVHCDVKGDNIFIANDGGKYIVKLGDFNLSHRLELESRSPDGIDSRSTQKGTIYFKPPEPEYEYKSDVWALGCTIIEMLTGKLPWTNVTRPPEDQIYIQNQLLAKKGPPIPDELKSQKEAYEFIELCLKPDLEQRRSAKELLNHPYSRVRTDS